MTVETTETGNNTESETEGKRSSKRRPRKLSSRVTMLVRRVHLYAGLFLLPWVFLYGITGAMYNHEGLFPEVEFRHVSAGELASTPLSNMPTASELAQQVVDALQSSTPDNEVRLADEHNAEYNNNIILEVRDGNRRRLVHMNPVTRSSWIATHEKNPEEPVTLLPKIKNVPISPNPYDAAKQSVPEILSAANLDFSGNPKSVGWCKLNFIADVDGEPARITYVLRDGHVDVEKYTGEDGMTPRSFFMRLHTSHGQPPSWNGRMAWSIILDIMAIAMVSWGVTGIVMWWQIKRTRMIGGVVIVLSITTACTLYYSMMHFYATTKL